MKPTEKKKLKKGDILLLLLYVDNCSPIRGRTRIQKMVFVFEKEVLKEYGFDRELQERKGGFFDFQAHNYGPFSRDVFEMLEFFFNIGMVKVDYSGDYEEALDSIDDEDIATDDLNSEADLENEVVPTGEPEYSLAAPGRKYVEERLIRYLSRQQVESLTKLKKSFNEYSLNRILKYVYTKYPTMAKESLIKEKILTKTWQY